MSEEEKTARPLHECLDTAYVSVAALVRYLERREFTGLLHVELEEYEADVFLRANEETRVRERNHSTGRAEEGEAAWQRLLVRSREPGGLVSVYEGEAALGSAERAAAGADDSGVDRNAFGTAVDEAGSKALTAEDAERSELLGLSGELIAAVERAVLVAGGDFGRAFHAARLGLAEDYPFLNPSARRFAYADGEVRFSGQASAALYVSAINEALRASVERVASVEQKLGVRKDAARELSVLLRRRQSRLERFKITRQQFERIAGMKLL